MRARKIQNFLSQPFHVAESLHGRARQVRSPRNDPRLQDDRQRRMRRASRAGLLHGRRSTKPSKGQEPQVTLTDPALRLRCGAGFPSLTKRSNSNGFIKVDVVSAEENILSVDAELVSLPGKSGELGILPGHLPLITLIFAPGSVRIHLPNKEVEQVFVAGGVLEVQPDVVTVLADTAIRQPGPRRGQGSEGVESPRRAPEREGRTPRSRRSKPKWPPWPPSFRRSRRFCQQTR